MLVHTQGDDVGTSYSLSRYEFYCAVSSHARETVQIIPKRLPRWNCICRQPGLAGQVVQQTPICRSERFAGRAWGKSHLTKSYQFLIVVWAIWLLISALRMKESVQAAPA